MITIYGLQDPLTEEIRYVGKTNNPRHRLLEHCRMDSGNHQKDAWIKGLMDEWGMRPNMIVLEEVANDKWETAERGWIAKGKTLGWKLLNLTEGGGGGGDGYSTGLRQIRSFSDKFVAPELKPRFEELTRSRQIDLMVEAARLCVPSLLAWAYYVHPDHEQGRTVHYVSKEVIIAHVSQTLNEWTQQEHMTV